MKKSLIILILSVLAICLPAQAEHLKFMGIPLTGTITQFQQKLTAKGVTHDKKASATAPIGTRIFRGKFAGAKAEIIVWYDADTGFEYIQQKNQEDPKFFKQPFALIDLLVEVADKCNEEQ